MSLTGETAPCPGCRADGHDASGDNLKLRDDGTGYCFRCRKSYGSGETVKKESHVPLEDIAALPFGNDPSRMIPPDILEEYGVRLAVDNYGEPDRVHYPYYDDRTAVAYKIRVLPKTFYATGNKAAMQWFRPAVIPKNPTGHLIITEGEEDALALRTILAKFKRDQHIVISLPSGVDSRLNLEFLSKWKKVVLAYDVDEPGKTAAYSHADKICTVADVYIATLPAKDASQCLISGLEKETWQALADAKQHTPEGILAGADTPLDSLKEATPIGVSLPFPILEHKLKGLRKAELTMVCAGSGIGKSTIVRELGYHLVKAGKRVCHIPLEDLVKTTQQAYIALDNNVPWPRLRTEPSILTDEQWENSYKNIIEKMYFFKHHGSLKPEKLMDAIRYYAKMKDVDYVILDHLSIVVSGLDLPNERKAIDIIMTQLAELVVETGVGLICVVHLKRREGNQKSLNSGGTIELSDLRGSAALEQLSWAVLGAERDQQAEDGTQDYIRLRLLKNRTWGYTGVCDTLRYDHATGRLVVSSIGELE